MRCAGTRQGGSLLQNVAQEDITGMTHIAVGGGELLVTHSAKTNDESRRLLVVLCLFHSIVCEISSNHFGRLPYRSREDTSTTS